jgi:endonuclease YncB( thermonuclease family)
MILRTILSLFVFAALGQSLSHAKKREIIVGPVFAQVVSIYDGDTIEVLARVWPGHQINVRVRIRGIDAPEMRARCASERSAAIDARDRLRGLIASRPVRLTNIRGGKYFGRVLADVETSSGRDMEEVLLAAGLVRPYRGKRRTSWC